MSTSTLLDRADQPKKIFNSKTDQHPVFLTFGQEIKKFHSEPLKRVLFFMKIEHLETKRRIEENEKNAPPTSSMEPLISGNNDTDLMLQRIKQVTLNENQDSM